MKINKQFKWEYIQSGKKIFMVFCKNGREIEKLTDLGQALKIQEQYKDELENNIIDFAKDQRDKVQARLNNEKYDEKTNFIKQAEWTKIQSKFKKSKQSKF